jgi:4-amino-4-deoxy-L-arabinose transferase-like glycosyltransferase
VAVAPPAARLSTRRAALLLLALCAVLRVGSLVRVCLSDDEATYAVVGREMLHGRVLYRDVVDHKPPLIYVTNAVTQAIGGPVGGMVLLHLLLIAYVWGTAMLLARLVRWSSRPRWSTSTRSPPTASCS